MMIPPPLTVVRDLTGAVAVGVVLAVVMVIVDLVALPQGRKASAGVDSRVSLHPVHPDVQVIALEGPLFFVGTENLRAQIRKLFSKPFLVLDFSNVPLMDETGALALGDLAERLQRKGGNLYIGGLNRRSLRMLARVGVLKGLGRSRIRRNVETAVRRASMEAAITQMKEANY